MVDKDQSAFDEYNEWFKQTNRTLEDAIVYLRKTRVDLNKYRKKAEMADLTEILKDHGPRFNSNVEAAKNNARIANRYMNALDAHIRHFEDVARFCNEYSRKDAPKPRAMDFDEFWQRLSKKLVSLKLFNTRARSILFGAVMRGDDAVRVITMTGKGRTIKKKEFERIWDMMKHDSRSERHVSRRGRYSKFWNPAYVCALIDDIVGNHEMR